MTRIRKHGFKSKRYLKVSESQHARWTKTSTYSNDHNYFSIPNISNATREEEVSCEGKQTRSSEDWREGRRIVELDVLATGLRACLKCGLPLQLGHTIDIQTYGLGCLLKVQCFNTICMHVNSVPTGKRHDRVWDVNSKLATALVHSGLGERQANSFLSELNIPAFSYKLVSARLKEVGNVVEEVAKESTNEALEKELAAVEQKKGSLVVAVDAGWQKRGSGRAYDSKSGHCSMIGPETGKIINYSVRSKECRVCSRAESRNESPREHACYRNWEGSSKGMEADMVIEMVKDVQSKGCTVAALVGDEDSTTIGRVRANISNSIEKISDRNHLKKILGNSLYSLKKNHPVLTVRIIKYLQSCFNYIIAQGEGNPEQIAKDLNALSKHPFGDHQCCSSRWCKFLSNPKSVFKSFPQGKPLSGSGLQKSLESVFEGYAKNSLKLSTVGSTQANESFNRMVSAKAPKHVHYSSSGNLNYRVAASVAQKNTGHRYLVNVNKKLGLSPGYHTQRLARLRDYQRSKQRALATTRAFKRKRLEKKAKMHQKLASAEVREGVSYQTGCSLDAAISDDIQSIPAPVITPEYLPLEPKTLNDSCMTYFDVETTGLGRDSHIIQLSAVNSQNTKFNRYIKPARPILPQASEVTGLKFQNGKMYHEDREVQSIGISNALKAFILFLKEIHNTVLVGHNSKIFDVPILINALEKNGLLNNFMSSVKGFIDTLPLFKECIPNQPSYSQPKIYNALFGELYSAHDSMEDVVALRRLFEKISPSLVLKSKFSGTNESVMQLYQHRNCTKGLLTTLRPLTNSKTITNCMATKIASSGLGLNHLKLAHKRDRQQGIENLFTELCGHPSKARVTKSKKIIQATSIYLNDLEE
ncbi:uncharacterized protein LOC134691329 [Mytilus trossulus]|uniref:uncharacterized protein LOC134691329 n=1 Tax=Mytilus trossulus TaxID=6551 RepID=UPI0030048FE3